MHLGIIGLGRMGANMARRLRRSDIGVTAFNRTQSVTDELADETGLVSATSIEELVAALPSPKIVWLMLPSGKITEQHVELVSQLLDEEDLLVDGANSWYKDSVRRAEMVTAKGIGYVDAGVSGGIWGLENGYALMVGGEKRYVELIEPALKVLAPGPDKGWHHCGPVGSGHFVKMVHNGIEYGMMQAFAEGFALMKSREDFDMDMAAIAEMWRHGSVVRSWLLDLSASVLDNDQELDAVVGYTLERIDDDTTLVVWARNNMGYPLVNFNLSASAEGYDISISRSAPKVGTYLMPGEQLRHTLTISRSGGGVVRGPDPRHQPVHVGDGRHVAVGLGLECNHGALIPHADGADTRPLIGRGGWRLGGGVRGEDVRSHHAGPHQPR